jgi:hypothetical protein
MYTFKLSTILFFDQPVQPGPASGYLQLVLLAVFIIPAILFLLTQQNTLHAVKPANRSMRPGLVWLQLIPGFGQVWQFLVVTRISNSITKERMSREEDSILGFSGTLSVEESGRRPTYKIGIAYCILSTIGVFVTFMKFVPPVFGLFNLAGVICWIIYWVQLAKYKRRLDQTTP